MTDAPVSPPAPTWSPEARTWASLLLFVHLLAIVVAVTTYTRPSVVQIRLHQLFDVYLRNLHLTAYPITYPFARYHLTHATLSDTDYSVEVEAKKPDGSTVTVTIPGDQQPLVRFRRYQALADAAGSLASGEANDAYATLLPKAIAASVLKQEQASSGSLRIRGHGLPDFEQSSNLDAVARAARDVTDVYDAAVLIGPSGVELLRRSTTLETAPVESSRRRAGEPAGKTVPKAKSTPNDAPRAQP